MSSKFLLVLAFLATTFSYSHTYAQTATDIHAKYGKSLEVYSVSEHIWMTPDYASDGQICRMRFYPKRISDNTNYGAHSLPFNELRDLLNVLVPSETRGAKKESFGATATGGGAAWTTYGYENVTFTFTSFFPSRSFEGQILKRGEYVFPQPQNEPTTNESNPGSNDFGHSSSTPTEIVTVTWNRRKCVGQ